MAGEMNHVLAGAAADFHHVAGLAGEEFLQHRPDRLMVTMKRGRVQPAIGLHPPAILSKLHDKIGHRSLALLLAGFVHGAATRS